MNLQRSEILGVEWFALTRRYEDEMASKKAFDRLMRVGERREGELEVGCYRHGRSDEPAGQIYVTVVGIDPAKVEFCGHVLTNAGGSEFETNGDVLTSLVWRRIRVLAELQEENAASGVYHYPHPDGMALDKFGREHD